MDAVAAIDRLDAERLKLRRLFSAPQLVMLHTMYGASQLDAGALRHICGIGWRRTYAALKRQGWTEFGDRPSDYGTYRLTTHGRRLARELFQ